MSYGGACYRVWYNSTVHLVQKNTFRYGSSYSRSNRPDYGLPVGSLSPRQVDDLIKTNRSLADERDRKEQIIRRQGFDLRQAQRRYEDDIRVREQHIRWLECQLKEASEFCPFEN